MPLGTNPKFNTDGFQKKIRKLLIYIRTINSDSQDILCGDYFRQMGLLYRVRTALANRKAKRPISISHTQTESSIVPLKPRGIGFSEMKVQIFASQFLQTKGGKNVRRFAQVEQPQWLLNLRVGRQICDSAAKPLSVRSHCCG